MFLNSKTWNKCPVKKKKQKTKPVVGHPECQNRILSLAADPGGQFLKTLIQPETQKWEIAQETIHGVNKELAMRDVFFSVNLSRSLGLGWIFLHIRPIKMCVSIITNQQHQHARETTGMLTEQIWTHRTHRIYVWYIYDHLCIFTIIYLHLVDICCICRCIYIYTYQCHECDGVIWSIFIDPILQYTLWVRLEVTFTPPHKVWLNDC